MTSAEKCHPQQGRAEGLPRDHRWDLYAGSGADGAVGMSSPTPSIPGGYVNRIGRPLINLVNQ